MPSDEKDDACIRMTIPSSPILLPVIRSTVEKFCEQLGFDFRTAGQVVLAVDEGLSNIMRHGYGGNQTKPIEIEISPIPSLGAAKGVRICLRDHGKTFDPVKVLSEKLPDPEMLSTGGLGVHIMITCMDRVDYQQAPGGGMQLTMIKFLPSESKGS